MKHRIYRITVAIAVLFFLASSYSETLADISNPHPIPPSDSVTAGMLKTNSVTDVKISSSTPVSLFKIGQAADGAVPYFDHNKLHASTSAMTFDITKPGLGIGSTSPAEALGVQGNAIVSGILSAAGITLGSSSIKSGPLTLTLPTVDGTSGYSLQTNGAGVLSFGSSGDWIKLGELITTSATTSLTFSFPTANYLRILIDIPDRVTSSAVRSFIRFNHDAGPVYSYARTVNAVGSSGSAQPEIDLNDQDKAAETWDINLTAIPNASTTVEAVGTLFSIGVAAPVQMRYSGVWFNSTSSPTSIFYGDSQNNYMATGTRIRIYGSSN